MAERTTRDPEFESLLNHIQDSRGIDFRGYKRTSLKRRINLRMDAHGTPDFAAYRSFLEAQPSEFEDLLNTVLINVTSFFRDPEAWEALATEVIPAIIAEASDDRPIRIWSVGCASGEEPYSIAMLLAERLGVAGFCRRVKIYATDLDEEALKVARLASYAPREVEGVPAELLEKYFERTAHHYLFQRELRKCVIFGRHNVVNDPPISRIDLITCRNLLIYLEGETQNVVLPRLHYALNGDGYLFLGKAETQLARSSLFRAIAPKHRIFAKVPQEWRHPSGRFVTRNRSLSTPSTDLWLLDAVVNEAGNALIAVDDNGIVVLANTQARHLLGLAESDLGRPFQDLPISYRPMELRGPIDDVFRQRRGTRLDDQEYRLSQHEVLRLTIDLRPLFRADGSVQGVLLVCTDQTRLHALQHELEAAQENLENSIEELQSANEELETTNEELQSTNEELETTNEELQSTNEELETLNEEARSTNEEIEAINEELRIQADQASNYRYHLESVLRAMNGGIIVLDRKHTVRSWNRWSEATWGLRADEVMGTGFETLDIGFPVHELGPDFLAVQSGSEEFSESVHHGIDRRGRRILCRVRVAALLDECEENRGLVLLFQDITEDREHEDYNRRLGRVLGHALNEIYFLDAVTLRFLLSNEGAQKKLGFSAAELTQMVFPDVVASVSAADVRVLIEPLISGERGEIVFETIMLGAGGREYPGQVCMQYFADESPPMLVAIVQETSERQQLGTA
jgi:two-component system CheB/CheR fusion protein